MQRKYRLKNTRAFSYIYRKGTAVKSHNMVLMTAPTKYPMQIGLSVSKKVGGAVVRNRVKRLLRVAFGQCLSTMDTKFNYVLIARPSIVGRSCLEVCSELKSVLYRAGKIGDTDA